MIYDQGLTFFFKIVETSFFKGKNVYFGIFHVKLAKNLLL